MKQITSLEIEIILLIEKYESIRINQDIVIDLRLILEKIRNE